MTEHTSPIGDTDAEPESRKPITSFTQVVFRDLVDLAKQNSGVFDELYYDRENEFTLFRNTMEDAYATAVNVLIVGDAGVGKSNFVFKLIGNQTVMDGLRLYPIYVDYRNQMPRNANGCVMHCVRSLEAYFESIGRPIHTLKEHSDAYLTHNMRMCFQHLEALPRHEMSTLPLIVLDDFDYADEEWYEMLDYFLPFTTSERASVVFTLRPLLLANIERYDDRFTHYYTRNCQRIILKHLDVARVLATRLAVLLLTKDETGLYGRIKARVMRNSHALLAVLRELGIHDLGDLPKFEYPFTEKHNVFMKRITNGNMREVFDIATDSLVFMFDRANRGFVTRRSEDGVERRSLGREGDMRLFYDSYAKKVSPYRILNMHQIRSKKGNSLLYNVLELVKLRQVIDDTFYSVCNDAGHLRADVQHALQVLSDKTHRFITPIRLRPARQTTLAYDIPEYVISDKGEYYLHMCTWDEYRARCGDCGESIAEKWA